MHSGSDTPSIKPATGLIERALRRFGFAGIYTPSTTIYLLPEYLNHPRLIRHELEHHAQMQRDGFVKFWVLIVWYLIRYGYKRSPYEIEARAAELQE